MSRNERGCLTAAAILWKEEERYIVMIDGIYAEKNPTLRVNMYQEANGASCRTQKSNVIFVLCVRKGY
jgi:hypothetical protein